MFPQDEPQRPAKATAVEGAQLEHVYRLMHCKLRCGVHREVILTGQGVQFHPPGRPAHITVRLHRVVMYYYRDVCPYPRVKKRELFK